MRKYLSKLAPRIKKLRSKHSLFIILPLICLMALGAYYAPRVFATSDFTVSNLTFDPATGHLEFDYTGTDLTGSGTFNITDGTNTYWVNYQNGSFNASCTSSHCWATLVPAYPDNGVSTVHLLHGSLVSQDLHYPLPLPTTYTSQNPSGSGGWTPAPETWTYASAQSFAVSGDQTAKYHKGTRLKWTQSSVGYGFVVSSSYSSPNTTVTIATDTDYSFSNTSFSNTFYSYEDDPQGYPGTFAFSPTINGGSLGNGTMNAYVSDKGNKVTVDIQWSFGSTSSVTGTVYFTGLPTYLNGTEIGNGYFYNNINNQVLTGSAIFSGGDLYPKGGTATYGTIGASVPWTWGTSDQLNVHIDYQM